jgi:hypothetical protein
MQDNGVAGQKRKASETLTVERRKITRACDSCKVYPPRTNFFCAGVIILTLAVGKRHDAPEHYHAIVASSCREPANTTRSIHEALRRLRFQVLCMAKMLYDVRRLQFDRPFIRSMCLRDQHLRRQVRRHPSYVGTRNHSPSCHRGVVHPNQKPQTWRATI